MSGYTLVGTTEEAHESDVRELFDTNYFGTLRVIQAALPLLRLQGSGHILGVSSAMGIVAATLIGFYCASKWAVEALHDSLAQEVKSFGIKVTLLEPGAFATDFGSPLSMKTSQGLEVYAELRNQVSLRLSTEERGDPNATADAILRIIDAEEPPLRFAVGAGVLPLVRGVYADRLATWETWETVSDGAQGTPRSHR